MPELRARGSERGEVRVLLATSRDWFASALQAVLEPEGFSFAHVRSGEGALEEAARSSPSVVVIDEGLPDTTAAELCERLVSGVVPRSVPLLVYSPNFWHETEQAEAMRAGAWDIIREPIRSRLLVAKLDRLLRIGHLIEATDGGAEEAEVEEKGLFSLTGLVRTVPVLGSIAERSLAPLSCAVLGPTAPASGERLERQREATARLCARHTRASDLCGFLGESDLALVAYNADVTATTRIVRRLSEAADAEEAEAGELSAGIVALPVGRGTGETRDRKPGRRAAPVDGEPVADRIASLARFAAAQLALREARAAGGGIRVAEPT